MAKTLPTKNGDIVAIDLNPTKGGEKGKVRPCLVLVGSGHPWGIIIVLPITNFSKARSKKLFTPIPFPDESTGLTKKSCIDCFQIRCLSEKRVGRKLGKVDDITLDHVLTRVGSILNVGEEHLTLPASLICR